MKIHKVKEEDWFYTELKFFWLFQLCCTYADKTLHCKHSVETAACQLNVDCNTQCAKKRVKINHTTEMVKTGKIQAAFLCKI
jgi:hypothetical protein